jgi:hypothetical protein
MTGDPVSHHSDPRRRRGAFAPPVDALAAAVHLELGADAMRAHVLERGPAPVPAPADPLDDDPPTGLLDLNAIRAAVAAGPIRSGHVDPAAAAWLAGASGPDALAAGRIVGQLEQLDPLPVAELLQPAVDRLVADGHVDPAVADEFAAQVAVDLVEMLDEPEPEPDHCGECHPELYRARCADGGCVAQSPEAVTEAPEAEPVVGGSDLHVYELSAAAPRSVMNAGGRVLDWVSRHDPRSLAYAARAVMAGSAPLADRLWPVGAVLDQQAEGACVGFGIVDALNAAAAGDVDRAAADALELYHDAQRVDDVPGENYSGTSVLAGLKAARSLGWLGGFRWCFGTRDIAQTVLQVAPVVVGVPWLSGMYETGPGGLVKVAGDNTGEGHCLAVVGLKLKGPQGQAGPYFVWLNSWGLSYGDRGLGYIHHRDLAGLLHGVGEAAVPMRAVQR